jgi:sugar/nucleoside kinase (ribokinase family)
MAQPMTVVCMGVHVLDILGRPIESIPEGQGGALVDEIRLAPAGSAGGTALTLAKLGAVARSAGAIGADPLGDVLLEMLQRFGVDTSLLVRRTGVQTSASIIPVRGNGDRPALHCIGANGTYTLDDVPWDDVAAATHLHLGGPELIGGDVAARILQFARDHGATTSADVLAPGDFPGILDMIAAALPYVDFFLPNAEQATGYTGIAEVVEACRALVSRGAGTVAATCGAEGVVIVDASAVERVPAFRVDVVDTSGCGDAFSAGFLRGLALGRDRRDAAVLGCAVAALVAQGLGSDFGDFTLQSADAFAAATPVAVPA